MRQFTGRFGDVFNMLFAGVLYLLVNLFLAKAVATLLRIPLKFKRQIIGSVVSGIYIFLCMITDSKILCSWYFYLANTILTAWLFFGGKKRCITGIVAFIMLYLALGGICIGREAVMSLIIGTTGICFIGFLVNFGYGREYLHVKFKYNSQYYELEAMRDTGNMLKDPITGQPVLIVAANIAQELTGLSADQLRSPIEAVSVLAGSRLIPYKTIGQSGSFLLGSYVQFLEIDGWQGSGVIAFSPEIFGSKGTYQALMGGTL